MKFLEQSHEILSLPTGLGMIEVAGRTCYQSEGKVGCTAKNMADVGCSWYSPDDDCQVYSCEHHSSAKFAGRMVKSGHHAMIEFGDIIVKFITNRGVTHELVRHRHCSFAQESTRYVKYDGEMEFIKPVWCSNHVPIIVNSGEDISHLKFDEQIWTSSMARAELDYKTLLKAGWKAQQAREVLPNSLKTEIVVKANIREWRHIFSLRCAKAAHPQMQGLMKPLLIELQDKIPVVFDGLI